jgi:7,8-dihydro-6-hydroxymethylpterin dimethyltransferase
LRCCRSRGCSTWPDYLDYVSNRVVPDYAIRDALEKLWSASAFLGTGVTEDRLTAAARALDCSETCGVNLPEAIADLTDRAFMIVVQDFQDPYTLNVKQLMKCCVEEITPDGRLIPFCAYNSVGYREQVCELMSGVRVADVVPNATGLQPLLADSPYGSKLARRTGGPAEPRVAADTTNVGRRLR